MTDSWLTASDRITLFAAVGLELYLDDDGQLRARGPATVLAAARPVIRQHRSAIIAHIRRTAAA